jgi:oligoribonuclease NrnB/cAMP/cGMP phosphodiesterase (DHH superfamily)
MDLILFHGHCPDGWCAAYVASKKHPEAKLISMDHGADHTEVLKECVHKDVLMVDFSLRTREENDTLAASTRSFQIYDHHKTAQAVLEGAPYAVFDMKRSGAGLTWDYLFGKDSIGDGPTKDCYWVYERPWYVDYVEDRDLWNWALPNSREVCAYLGTLELNKEDWDKLDSMEWASIAGQGMGAVAHINHYVREAVKQAQSSKVPSTPEFPVAHWGHSIAVLNVPYLNCSEIGNELAKTNDISLTWFERGDGVIQFSLRSVGEYDISTFAKAYNGGGHRNAAGFQLSLKEGRDLVDKVLGRNV